MLINPSQPFFWKSVCSSLSFTYLPYNSVSIHLQKKRYRKKFAWCDLFPEHQVLISVSMAHWVLHLSAEMAMSGANWCQLGWCNLRDGANQVANQNKKKGLELWCFVFLWDFCFVFTLPTFFFFFIIFTFEMEHQEQVPLIRDDLVFVSFGGSLSEEAQGGFLFWFPQFHLERTDFLSLCGVESIEQPWEAKHNTGQTKVLAWDYSSSFPWHKELFHLHSMFPITFPAIQFNSCQADYEGKKMMQQSKSPLSRSKKIKTE